MSDVEIKVPEARHREAKTFLDFLRKAARNRSVSLSVSTPRPGEFLCSFPSKDGLNLDLFLQELTFNRGLYYYLCNMPKRRETAKSVVLPVMMEVLGSRFNFVNPSVLRTQILGGATHAGLVAAELSDEHGQQYERLFHQQKLRMISNYEFIRNLDDLLTNFMLFQLEYKKGAKTPQFDRLVDECGRKQVLREKEIRGVFKRVHALRTRGLHRMERELPDTQVAPIAYDCYNFFEYVRDYLDAQDERTVMLRGRRYRRIRYGDGREYWGASSKEVAEYKADAGTRPCHDCGVIKGELHLEGCDVECCPRCNRQYLGCPCHFEEEEYAEMFAQRKHLSHKSNSAAIDGAAAG
jgi:hypothetical protein